MKAPELTPAQKAAHRISWFVIDHDRTTGEKIKIPREGRIIGLGYDAECSCGWESKTGGAIMARVEDAVWDHKFDVAHGLVRS